MMIKPLISAVLPLLMFPFGLRARFVRKPASVYVPEPGPRLYALPGGLKLHPEKRLTGRQAAPVQLHLVENEADAGHAEIVDFPVERARSANAVADRHGTVISLDSRRPKPLLGAS